MRGIFSPGMRAYFVPLVAGITLAVSAFLPWVIVGSVSMAGVPDVEALWIVGLGGLAAILALLSLITRRNSRHPLLIIGLFALGIMFLSWRIMPRTAGEQQVPVRPAEPELPPVVRVALAKQGERADSWDGVLARQRLGVVVEVEQQTFAMT